MTTLRLNNVTIKQLVEDFTRYLYLPRLKDPAVLLRAIQDGLALLSWSQDSFAYAESYDEASGRYRGLRCCQGVNISEDNLSGLLAKPAMALKQMEDEKRPADVMPAGAGASESGETVGIFPAASVTTVEEKRLPVRFYGAVELDATRLGRDAGNIAKEVVQHLSALMNANVEITLEIKADVPEGVPDNVVRTVTENCRTLKFKSHGFEEK